MEHPQLFRLALSIPETHTARFVIRSCFPRRTVIIELKSRVQDALEKLIAQMLGPPAITTNSTSLCCGESKLITAVRAWFWLISHKFIALAEGNYLKKEDSNALLVNHQKRTQVALQH